MPTGVEEENKHGIMEQYLASCLWHNLEVVKDLYCAGVEIHTSQGNYNYIGLTIFIDFSGTV